jgi:hypothetical protein
MRLNAVHMKILDIPVQVAHEGCQHAIPRKMGALLSQHYDTRHDCIMIALFC